MDQAGPGIHLAGCTGSANRITSYCKTIVLVLAITILGYDIIQACYDLLVLGTTILGIQGQYDTAYIVRKGTIYRHDAYASTVLSVLVLGQLEISFFWAQIERKGPRVTPKIKGRASKAKRSNCHF